MPPFVQTLPTRNFILVIDPYSLEEVAALNGGGVRRLVQELRVLRPPIRIRLVFPAYLAGAEQLSVADALAGVGTLSRDIPRRHRERIERGAEGDCRGLRLLTLAPFPRTSDSAPGFVPVPLARRGDAERRRRTIVGLPRARFLTSRSH